MSFKEKVENLLQKDYKDRLIIKNVGAPFFSTNTISIKVKDSISIIYKVEINRLLNKFNAFINDEGLIVYKNR